jgi:hypothetical protein
MVAAANYAPGDCASRLNDTAVRDLVMAEIKKMLGTKVRAAGFDVTTCSLRNCWKCLVHQYSRRGNNGRIRFVTG